MSFSIEEKLPGNYFQEVMNAQTEMIRMYLDDLDNPLIFSQYCGNTIAIFKFYSCNGDNTSPHYIILFPIWGIWKNSCITSWYNSFIY